MHIGGRYVVTAGMGVRGGAGVCLRAPGRHKYARER